MTKIIYTNIFIFIILQIYSILKHLNSNSYQETVNKITEILGASSLFNELIKEPWTIITHIFYHNNYWHLLVNLFFLYFFGKIFSYFIEEKKILQLYILGGLFGYIIYFISINCFNIFESKNTLIGASASIYAIMTTSALFSPNYRIYIPVIKNIKLSNLVALYILLDILFIPLTENPGGHISHLGGVFSGWLYYIFLKKQKQTKLTREMSDDEWRLGKKDKEQKLNEILEKISKSGFDSLNKNEKIFLSKQK